MKKIIPIFILQIVLALSANSQTAKIIAGDGVTGYNGNNLAALSTELNNVGGVAFDKYGNVYIADASNNIVRKIDSAGNIVIIAGTTVLGYNGDNIPATSAELALPIGLAFDKSGNLYITDQANNRIRKVDSSGTITTIAGNGVLGTSGDGGPATNAELSAPSGVALDPAGNIYSTDQNGYRVRKIDTNGIITTVVGTGTSGYSGDNGLAINATLSAPYGICFDKHGNMYIADLNGTIRKVDTGEIITTVAGTGTGGYNGDGIAATNAELFLPEGVALDAVGNLYIADGVNYRIRRVDTNGIISTFASDTGQIVAKNLEFESSVNIDAYGNVYFTDADNAVVWEVSLCPAAPVIYPQEPTVCSGQSVTLSLSGLSGISYTWSPSSGLNSTTGDTVMANPTATVTYMVTSIYGNCISTDTDIVTVTPAPNVPTISQHDDTLFSSAQTNDQWFLNDTLIPGATGNYLVISQEGSYSVAVTNPADGCVSNSEPLITSGIEQLTANVNQLSVYPNPTTGTITISSTKNIDKMKIYNVLGQLVYEAQPRQTQFNFELKTDGVYFIAVISNNQNITQKIIVAR